MDLEGRSFASVVAELAQRRGWSLREVARRTHLSRGAVQRFATGPSVPHTANEAYNLVATLADSEEDTVAIMRLWAEEHVRREAPTALRWLWRVGEQMGTENPLVALHNAFLYLMPEERGSVVRLLSPLPMLKPAHRTELIRKVDALASGSLNAMFQVTNANPIEKLQRECAAWRYRAETAEARLERSELRVAQLELFVRDRGWAPPARRGRKS